jgi:hypothetical protein
MTRRFFAFGCSHTAFAWPTWADLVGLEFPNQYYNYGRSGAGNFYMFQMLVQTNIYHKFTKDDLIVFQWSETTREDRYIKNWWHTNGNIVNGYDKMFINKWVDDKGSLIRDLACIEGARLILDSIGCEYYFTALNEFVDYPEVLEVYKDTLTKIKPSYRAVLGNYTTAKNRVIGKRILVTDPHPTPGEHYKYLETVLPHLVPQNAKDCAQEWDETLADTWLSHNQGWGYTWDGIDRGFLNIKLGL